MSNVLLVDDHHLVVDGIKNLLQDIPNISVIDTCDTGQKAIDRTRIGGIDLILMDLDMPEMTGIEATRVLKSEMPDVKILILSMHNEKGMIKQVMEAGADGYLLKNAHFDQLNQAIGKVLSGDKYFSSEVTLTLLQEDEASAEEEMVSQLTEREREILKMIAEGYSNKEIGDKLFISHRTVDTHRTNLMRKMDVHNIANLIKIAMKSGLLSED